MLNPRNNSDRLDYGQILAPPADYNLDFAVGTTYSLDLDALVGASLALGLSAETDSELMSNPVCLLEALRSTGDKVALFCEGGQIHLPGNVNSLYILLEKMVFPVKTAKANGIAAYPSFHPKFWLIKYVNNSGDSRYRIIVLSRNLTFDRSWDVTYYLDGQPADRRTSKNEPVCDFLRYLIAQLPDNEKGQQKAEAIQNLITELSYVTFETAEKEFTDFEFIPNGVAKSDGGFYRFNETLLFTDTFREIAIVSPFISGGIIRDFNNRNDNSGMEHTQYLLITREQSLSKLKKEDADNFAIYTLKDQVVDGETAISDDSKPAQKQDIHAKMYMVRKHTASDLYLGSLNASHNAVYGNVEFMIRLRSKNRYLNMEKFKAALFGADKDEDNPFREVTLENAIIEDNDDHEKDLDTIIKNINRSNPQARVERSGDMYSAIVSFGLCDLKDCKVVVRPLLSEKRAVFAENVCFESLAIDQLSEFYVVAVSDEERTIERVLVIPTEGLPEEREKSVVTRVVNNKECFYRYIAFLLGDDQILSIIEANAAERGNYSSATRQIIQVPALYEKMLKTAATAPEKFRGIEYLMKTISDDGIFPDDFKQLYETFKKAVNLHG